MGEVLLAVSRVRNRSAVHKIPARANESTTSASSESSTLHCLTCHVFLEERGCWGWRPSDGLNEDAFADVPFVGASCYGDGWGREDDKGWWSLCC